MKTGVLVLRTLAPADEPSFREAMDEFRGEHPPWDFALGWEEGMSFPAYLELLDRIAGGRDLPAGFVPASFYVGIVDGAVVGRLSLRHRLNESLSRVGGHIGYGVRPSRRGRGFATEMLRQALPLAAALGVDRALLTCDVDNAASAAVIERCGGEFEGVTSDPALAIQKRRYWLRTLGRPPA
jgi:predicted acetyltransferase